MASFSAIVHSFAVEFGVLIRRAPSANRELRVQQARQAAVDAGLVVVPGSVGQGAELFLRLDVTERVGPSR
jgi:hypothetical protein